MDKPECLYDKETSINTATVPLTASVPIQVVGPNPKRVALIFSAVGSAVAAYGATPTIAANVGFSLVNGASPFKLLRTEIGKAICMPWYVFTASANTTITVTEIVEVG